MFLLLQFHFVGSNLARNGQRDLKSSSLRWGSLWIHVLMERRSIWICVSTRTWIHKDPHLKELDLSQIKLDLTLAPALILADKTYFFSTFWIKPEDHSATQLAEWLEGIGSIALLSNLWAHNSRWAFMWWVLHSNQYCKMVRCTRTNSRRSQSYTYKGMYRTESLHKISVCLGLDQLQLYYEQLCFINEQVKQ
jgi:hypothetical protein